MNNDLIFKKRRKELRRNQTQAEKIIWSKLRNKQINGLKFYRQWSIGSYILDFYCHPLKLAIEIDGGQHNENDAYERIRTQFLQKQNITLLRFWNNEVLENIDGVMNNILEESNLLNNNSSRPPLIKRRSDKRDEREI